jgi:hypothetical protein
MSSKDAVLKELREHVFPVDMTSTDGAITLTIVANGYKHPLWDQFWEDFIDSSWHVMDIRTALPRDPHYWVGQWEDGTYHNTQRAVFAQEKFPQVVKDILWEVVSKRPSFKIMVCCNRGMHRANTCARCVQECLNLFVDNKGNRKYNAMIFPMVEIWSGSYYQFFSERLQARRSNLHAHILVS